ncbi:MAG: protease family protein [Euryarchaeota archaeon]|nr:protease family protein [Euryarchaeota archaeon]
MKKSIKFHKGRNKLEFLIASALILALLAIYPAAASVSSLQLPSYLEIGDASAKIYNNILIESLGVTLTSYENFGLLKEIGQHINALNMLGGVWVAFLLGLLHVPIIKRENGLIKYFRKALYSFKIRRMVGTEEAVQEKVTARYFWLYIAIPILCIVIAELLIFSGRLETAVWIHIGVLIALSLSSIFIKDTRIHKIYMPLMLLPILRLVNLSMPIFFKTTLYTFIFVYSPLVASLAVIIIHQRTSLEEIGITKKHFLTYMILSVPLGFLLGLGEYLIIRPGYLIPDLTLGKLLMLTIIMVFFVGLVEELIFRSILQVRFEQILGVQKALIITSLLFGLMHSGYGTFYEMLYTGFVGLVIGVIFHKTRSLPFVAILHGMVNVFLFGVLPLYLLGWR